MFYVRIDVNKRWMGFKQDNKKEVVNKTNTYIVYQ